MPTPEEIFDSLDESSADDDHASETPDSSVLSQAKSTELLGGAASTDYDDSDDLERNFRATLGPHEFWESEQDTGEVEKAARDRAERLRAADAAASSLEGAAGNLVDRCPPEDPKHTLEVELFNDTGPVTGGLVELRRKGQDGILAMRSNGQGKARFEGLRDSDSHQLRVLGCGAWSIEGSEPLPENLSKSRYDALWALPPDRGDPAVHKLVQGECLWTLANRLGLDADALWEANPDLHKGERLQNVLAPDDMVSLSQDEPILEDVSPGDRVRIRCEPAEARARLRFQNDEGAARSRIDFMIRIVTRDGTEHVWSGKTDGDGALDEAVPAEALTMEITLATEPDPEVYHFRFAYLDPLETVSGVQGRLFNLGFWCGSERGEVGPLTRRALREFQNEYGLSESGEIDAATRSKLNELYEP